MGACARAAPTKVYDLVTAALYKALICLTVAFAGYKKRLGGGS